jgi:hypothetical protein
MTTAIHRDTRPARPSPRCRPLTLLDAMGLVAAVATGLALGKILGAPNTRVFRLPPDPLNEIPCLAALTLGVWLLRLRKPRSRLRLLMRQPGMVATSTALLTLLFAAGVYGLTRVAKFVILQQGLLRLRTQGVDAFLVLVVAVLAGAMVTGAWTNLALSGRRRPEPGWLDRLGRVVGTLWVVHCWAVLGVYLLNYR